MRLQGDFNEIPRATLHVITFNTSTYASDDIQASLTTLKDILAKYGEVKIEGTDKAGDLTAPALYFGRRKLNNNYSAVDNVKKKHGGTATIFVKDGEEFVRITTNVIKDDGNRAVGTKLAKNDAYKTVMSGSTFCGRVDILGHPYDTCYEPIKDKAGAILGIYYVGYKRD